MLTTHLFKVLELHVQIVLQFGWIKFMVIKVGWLWMKNTIYARFVPIAFCALATHRLWKFIAESLRSFRIWTTVYKHMLYHEPRRFAFQCTNKIPFTGRLVTGSISFNAKFTWTNTLHKFVSMINLQCGLKIFLRLSLCVTAFKK